MTSPTTISTIINPPQLLGFIVKIAFSQDGNEWSILPTTVKQADQTIRREPLNAELNAEKEGHCTIERFGERHFTLFHHVDQFSYDPELTFDFGPYNQYECKKHPPEFVLSQRAQYLRVVIQRQTMHETTEVDAKEIHALYLRQLDEFTVILPYKFNASAPITIPYDKHRQELILTVEGGKVVCMTDKCL